MFLTLTHFLIDHYWKLFGEPKMVLLWYRYKKCFIC